jgi:hypothetical protein
MLELKEGISTVEGDAVQDDKVVKAGEAMLVWCAKRSLIVDGKDCEAH